MDNDAETQEVTQEETPEISGEEMLDEVFSQMKEEKEVPEVPEEEEKEQVPKEEETPAKKEPEPENAQRDFQELQRQAREMGYSLTPGKPVLTFDPRSYMEMKEQIISQKMDEYKNTISPFTEDLDGEEIDTYINEHRAFAEKYADELVDEYKRNQINNHPLKESIMYFQQAPTEMGLPPLSYEYAEYMAIMADKAMKTQQQEIQQEQAKQKETKMKKGAFVEGAGKKMVGPNLTQEEKYAAMKLGITPEEYAKWK